MSNPNDNGAAGGAAGGAGTGDNGGQGAGAAPANAGGSAGTGGGAAAGAGAAGSALAAAGGAQGGAGAAGAAPDWIPEKYQVRDATGAIDLEASSRKLAEGYQHASQRIGSGEAPPATPDDYAPEGLTEGIDLEQLKADPQYRDWLKGAHALGINNKQLGYIVNGLAERLDQVYAGRQIDFKAEAMKADGWQTEADFNANMALAHRAFKAYATPEEMERITEIADDPILMRILSRVGKEIGEDRPTAGAGGPIDAGSFDEQVAALRANPAYGDKRHPEHDAVMAKIQGLYDRRYGTKPRQTGFSTTG